jgi:hypothetical protein
MNFTTLFVELLMVGIGTATWLVLFLAAILQYKFDTIILTDNKALIGTLIAVVYVLGIVIDRLIGDIFKITVEADVKRRILNDDRLEFVNEIAPDIDVENFAMKLEKFIRFHSQSLAIKFDYNRSRFRICRAWFLHFILIGISFMCWNVRVHVLPLMIAIWLLAIDIIFLVLTWKATSLLAEDSQKDLIESFEIIMAAGRMKQEK